MTDSQLQRAVLDELQWEPSVNTAHFGVAVCDGFVTLTGHAGSYAEKLAADKAAKRLYGVKAVANQIDVQPTGPNKKKDDDIASAVVTALH
jgi:osmotically-inducible protein OsmY